jgi:hypothetical protein
MKKMIFVSRHTPTPAQLNLSLAKGYELVHVGDVNAFDHQAIRDLVMAQDTAAGYPVAVSCVHPAMALYAICGGRVIGVFENANRAPEGGKPSFEASALHLIEVYGVAPESGGSAFAYASTHLVTPDAVPTFQHIHL